MKTTTVLSLPLLASGAVVEQEIHRRQATAAVKGMAMDLFGLTTANKTPQKAVNVKTLTAGLDQKAIKEQVLWGPFKLQPANGEHKSDGTTLRLDKNSDVITTRVANLCRECMVLSAKADLADKDGNKVDVGSGVYSHHIIMTSLNGQRMVMPPAIAKCPNGKLGGFNFSGMVKAAPNTGAGHGHKKRQAPKSTTPKVTDPKAPVPKLGVDTPRASAPTDLPVPPSPKAATAIPSSTSSAKGPTAPTTLPKGAIPLNVQPPPPGGPPIAPPSTGSNSDLFGDLSIPGLPSMDALAPILGGTAGSIVGALAGTLIGALLGAPLGALLGVAASTDLGKTILGGKGTTGNPLAGGLSPGSLGAGLASMAPKVAVFVGQGDDGSGLAFSNPKASFKSGFYLGKETEVNLMAEVINYNQAEKDIYVKVEYEYLPDMPSRPEEYYEVGMGAINVAPCESVNLMPPKDAPIKYTSPPWSVINDGYLLDIKPHLHDGGVNMTFYVNNEKRCTSSAVYGGGSDGGLAINGEKWETITSYTGCPEPVQIKAGDSLTMDAWYDLSQHKLRPHSNDHSGEAEGMALANFLFAHPSKK